MSNEDIGLHGASDDDRNASDLSNDELVEEFLDAADAKDATVEFYRRNISPFVDYVESKGGHLTEHVSDKDIKDFLEAEANEYAPKTVRHRYSAVSRFYNTLREEALLPRDAVLPSETLDTSSVSGLSQKTTSEIQGEDEFHYLTPEEVSALIENVPAPELRNRAALLLMANTGLRASELIRVELGKIDLEQQELTVLSPKLSDDNESDPKWITVYWRSQRVSEVLDSYIEFERPSYPSAAESDYLFPSKQSERLSYSQLNRIVKQAAENAGVQEEHTTDAAGNERKQVTSHILRHSYAMEALENGMSIDEIRDVLHHSDISVTMKYLRRHEEDKRRAVQKNGPQFG